MNPYDVFMITQPFASAYDLKLTIQGGGVGPASNKVIQLRTLLSTALGSE